jgi:transcription termination/antitermination protein NusA
VIFVTNAISPAKVQRVSIIDDAEKVIEVIVEDKQLSLAIGKKGQNVRLAAKLTGWKIDIKSEEEKRREVEEQFGEMVSEPGEGEAAEPGLAAAESAQSDAPSEEGTEAVAESVAPPEEASETAGETVAAEAANAAPEQTSEPADEAAVAEATGEKSNS